MQLFGDLDIFHLVRISRLNWVGHVNGMESARKVSQVFNIIPQRSWLGDDLNTDGGILCKRVLINSKLQIWKRSKKTELTGRSLLQRQTSAVHPNATEEEKE